MSKINRQWCLVARPIGMIKDSDFEWREVPVPALAEGEVLVRNIYLSLDPANRGWMNEAPTYVPAVPLGSVMHGGGLGVVEESRHKNFNVGDLVQGMFGWQEYAVTTSKDLTPLPKDAPFPLTTFFGLLGHIGLTAYFGLLDVGKPQAGETLVVSAAAGAVGSIVGQIGKIKGCRVVGLAGSDEKCQWLTNELGFDAAINYKTEDVSASLKKHCPKGIDVYFDNVGGQILDAVLGQINHKARISVCGLISMYNADKAVPGPYNFHNILTKSATIQGFIILDYLRDQAQVMAASGELIGWLMAGKIKYRLDVVKGLEHAPQAINRLFDGSNQGKLIIQISDEPK